MTLGRYLRISQVDNVCHLSIGSHASGEIEVAMQHFSGRRQFHLKDLSCNVCALSHSPYRHRHLLYSKLSEVQQVNRKQMFSVLFSFLFEFKMCIVVLVKSPESLRKPESLKLWFYRNVLLLSSS